MGGWVRVGFWKDSGKRERNFSISPGVSIGHSSGSGNLEQYMALRPLPVESFTRPHADTRRLLNPPHARIKGIDWTILSIITTFITSGRCRVSDNSISASWQDLGSEWSLIPIICVALRIFVMRIAFTRTRESANCRLHKLRVAPVSHKASAATVSPSV
jgi:hypothetical protein